MTVAFLFKLAFGLVAWSGTLMLLGGSKAKRLNAGHKALGVIAIVLFIISLFVK